MDKKKVYEAPQIEVVEFELSDNIAMSADMGPGLSCGEWYGGDES